ncbi:unnamed protein product, partial [Rotaria sp. Silwood2]
IHLLKKKEKSRVSRSCDENLQLIPSQSISSSLASSFETNNQNVSCLLINIDTPNDEDDIVYDNIDECTQPIADINNINKISMLNSSVYSDSIFEENDSTYSIQLLHPYTDIPTAIFCRKLLQTFRDSKLSKNEHHKFLNLIHDALPIPNNLPLNMNKLFSLIQIKKNLFNKKKICLMCTQDIASDMCFCPTCPNSNDTNIAIIYQSDIKSILTLLLKHLYPEIREYTKQLRANHDELGTHDIGFGYAYQQLLRKFSDENFITALMHLDG